MAFGSAFVAGTVRAVRGSLGRFLAIMGITALGCGFYAGLQMCGPDMRTAADAWYDGYRVWDLRLVSTLGWGDDDVGRIESVEGVEAVMPQTSVDAMARLGAEQVAVRIATMDVDAAEASEADGLTVMRSQDGRYLNRARLVEGSWPHAADECVACADATTPGFGVGSTVEVLSTAAEAEGMLSSRRLRVVGMVTSASYPYSANFGSTSLGSGMIEQYLYVPVEAMGRDVAYTDVFVRVAGADAYESESGPYRDAVNAVAAGFERRFDQLSAARLADVRGDAEAQLADGRREAAEARADAEAQLADGKAQLDAAASELATGRQALAAGEAEHAAGLSAYCRERSSAEAQLSSAEAELAAGEAELAAGERRMRVAAQELADAEGQFADGQAAYDVATGEIAAAEAELAAGEAELATRTGEALAALASQGLPAATLDEAEVSVSAARAEAGAAQARLDDSTAGIAQLRSARAALASGGESSQLSAMLEQLLVGLVAQGCSRQDANALVAGSQDVQAWADGQGLTAEETQHVGELVAQARALSAQLAQCRAAEAELAQQEGALLAALASQGLPAATLDEAEASVSAARAEAGAAQARLDEAAAGIAQLKAAAAELASGRVELDAGRARLLASAGELADAQAQIVAGRAELDAGATELAAGRARLSSGRDELVRGRAEASQQFAVAEARLADGAATLAASRAQLEAGERDYERGLAAWQEARVDAERQLADADARLADAQADIDALEAPDLYVLDRTKSEGVATYHADTERIDAIADVFPFIFFLVAALIALTTMTRMVEDERVQIGTYKALGYGTAAIASRYLAYAAVASVVGAAAGIAVLSQVLPLIITSAYGIIYAVPSLAYPLPVNLPVALASGGLGVGVTLVATWVAVVTSLRENPATLMLPRAPVAGRRILLERVAPVWRRLSFSWKVTCRNLFRYKRRLLMTVVGISGCTALLLVGFGLHDAIWDIIDCQYGPIIHYDTTVGLDAEATKSDVDAVVRHLTATGEAGEIIRVHDENMQARGEMDEVTTRVQVVVPTDADSLEKAVTLRDRMTGEEVAFDDEAVVVTEKLAMKYGLGVGDTLMLFGQDATGNVVGEGVALAVTGIAENYVGNLVYLGPAAWARVDAEEPVFDTLHTTTTPDAAVRSKIAESLHGLAHVSTVVFSTETIDVYRTMLTTVDMIVVVLIVSAAALAFIVLYNLTNINVAERVREIASLKVLGFTRREVYAYIFREMLLLAVIGALLGMLLGTWLASFVITTAEVDYVMFGRTIHSLSYVYAFALTVVFAVGIAFLMRGKLDRVDMVESLKSVE